MQRLLTEIRHMLLAFQIMSRIPINIALPCQPDDMIGLDGLFSTGGRGGGRADGARGLAGGTPAFTGSYIAAAAALMVLCDVLVTGGIHMDGLGDTCDGFFSGRDCARVIWR